MKDLLVALRTTASGNEKKRLLLEASQNPQDPNGYIAKAFKLCYDPFILSYITNIKSLKEFGTRDFYSSFEDFEYLINRLNDREITGNEARDVLQSFLKKCDPDTQYIYSCIIKGNMKCGVNATTLNKIWPNLVTQFKVQLANKYDQDRDYEVDFWYASPKLDGIRCIYINGNLYTRAGKPLIGFDKLQAELKEMADRLRLRFIDGELYSHEIPFQLLQGSILSSKNLSEKGKEKIKLNVFAVGDVMRTNQMCEIMSREAKRIHEFITFVEYAIVKNTYAAILEACNKHVAKGYEGVMLRNPNISYSWKRDDNLLKFKLFREDDFTVVGYQEGNDKFEGTLGALLVEGIVDGKRIVSNVGSGFSDEMRNEIWKNKNLKTVEVKYQNITDSPNDEGNYSLRFPVMLKTKEDR